MTAAQPPRAHIVDRVDPPHADLHEHREGDRVRQHVRSLVGGRADILEQEERCDRDFVQGGDDAPSQIVAAAAAPAEATARGSLRAGSSGTARSMLHAGVGAGAGLPPEGLPRAAAARSTT
eukprot:CAMPEP_0182878438 /NCGR_PEP_ID=MMETSP0034_2-20130328/15355_1 /TAXON_ID=156128 /ORGANISM="Nephroselmis pyriformis, Strain CCMP717" /LENGTH=120 /DNA_ID=CAMNT_0025011323 /DNA_START=425 /DNA_END=785 /DNA_ORIENTATION=+